MRGEVVVTLQHRWYGLQGTDRLCAYLIPTESVGNTTKGGTSLSLPCRRDDLSPGRTERAVRLLIFSGAYRDAPGSARYFRTDGSLHRSSLQVDFGRL